MTRLPALPLHLGAGAVLLLAVLATAGIHHLADVDDAEQAFLRAMAAQADLDTRHLAERITHLLQDHRGAGLERVIGLQLAADGVRALLVVDEHGAVIACTGSCAALARFEDDPRAVDLLLSDTDLADPGGHELAHAVRARRPDLPVVLCGAGHDRAAAGAACVDALLDKPVAPGLLVATVLAALDGKAALRH